MRRRSQIKSNGVGCEKCPLGKERPRTMSNCSTCVKGYVATSRGKAYCEPCPAGTFAANETTCIGCPAGSYCREGSSEPSPCPEGTYCPKGSENPISVKAGKYTNAHRTNTSTCEPGFYCINGERFECPEYTFGDAPGLTSPKCNGECSRRLNQYSGKASTECFCKATFERMNDTELTCMCAPGRYRASEECKMCSGDGYTDVYNTLDKCELCSDELLWYTANEDHTGCKIHMEIHTSRSYVITFLVFSVVYFIRRRLRNANARVANLKRKGQFRWKGTF